MHFIVVFFFIFTSCTSAENHIEYHTDDAKVLTNQHEEKIDNAQPSFHEEVARMTPQEREWHVQNLYKEIVNAGEKRQMLSDIVRQNRHQVAPNYPDPRDLASEGMHLMQDWYTNHPDEVADYILFVEKQIQNQ